MNPIYSPLATNVVETDLGWLQYQLAEVGIEKTIDEIYWAIYADAGRDEWVAKAMLATLATDDEAFNKFADSLRVGQRSQVVFDSRLPVAAALLLFSLGLLAGFLIGVIS